MLSIYQAEFFSFSLKFLVYFALFFFKSIHVINKNCFIFHNHGMSLEVPREIYVAKQKLIWSHNVKTVLSLFF